MLSSSSMLGRNGIYDWLLVRISAILLALYIFYLVGFFILKDTLTYDIWRGFFSFFFTKIFTILALFSVLIHSWIGMWQVLSDYVKSLTIRFILHIVIIVALLIYTIYGAVVIWSV
ncbi:succinate dehydrogenase, hydrophobic membrane anchor protein [Pantoea sp. Mhis]|uniref:succinate dehydrogenase, hydrophobic membrane anchor protein n=1 Tax=Pantoea sp. Mhis TaxID=2576759 RepID=UPI0013568E8F|nr:succinate dehydrogenase, hydrophobic membrane anchor protein [Pantoea sp. Mhis]MXP56283.1 succinate dehydrogenase, hydrophobic membrane anchor protein [Pantoea sp. Mhis]